MPFKFRLRGLAETFVNNLVCPNCGFDAGEKGESNVVTDLSRVTYDGIVVVIQCESCSHIFVPDGQRLGIINSQRLRSALEADGQKTGEPILPTLQAVKLEVERMNALKRNGVH